MNQNVYVHSLMTQQDVELFKAGKHYRLYNMLGSHLLELEGVKGTFFAVWAPNAKAVSVIGDFNGWNKASHQLFVRLDGSGIWEGFIPGVQKGTIYKYFIHSHEYDQQLEKGDPFALYWETPPRTASVVWDKTYTWKDKTYLKNRSKQAAHDKPFCVYEVHIGSWDRVGDEQNRQLSYREMADKMVPYVKEMGYTHIEFMPVMEHPFYGSWGYQITGYFAPSSRYGTPQDFMYLIDAFHQAGIGVLLDWVPSHFPEDLHGLGKFDGTALFEHADPRKGFHPDWKSLIFNYGRYEVRAFLISNALYWLDLFHVDGLRVDAVASMLYLDYSRKDGEWIPNEHGGRENLEAISFLREFNEAVYQNYPDTVTIAEESTAFPGVSRPAYLGGLGFGQKWMMGWMHDTLNYFKKDPIHRKYHQHDITFSLMYAFTENFMLPLSHDEVVHGKGALIQRMPGDEWQQFANLRLLYGMMYMHPGHKLLFMGGDIGQTSEWNHESCVDWQLLQYRFHKGVNNWVKTLNHFYQNQAACYGLAFEAEGFEWIDYSDSENSVLVFIRKAEKKKDTIVVVANMTPALRQAYRIGLPFKGNWTEVLNSDATEFGGSNALNSNIKVETLSWQGRDYSMEINLAPLAVMVFAVG
jgi:1,4-alpha-glucan branching enzyme